MRTLERHGPIGAVGPRPWRDLVEDGADGEVPLAHGHRRRLHQEHLRPINIAQYAGLSALGGITYFLGFLALVSISLGVLNLLPIPILDGGQIVYQLAEIVKGRPLSEEAADRSARRSASRCWSP
jgi:hypothetical protein